MANTSGTKHTMGKETPAKLKSHKQTGSSKNNGVPLNSPNGIHKATNPTPGVY